MRHRSLSIAAMAALLAAVAVAMSKADPAVAATRSFQTPSKNIVCLYNSRGPRGPSIRCDVLSLNDVGFTLERRRRARRIRITDTVADTTRARVLRYGTSRPFGPFRCTSRRSGLTCRSRESAHGFKLSRARQRVF